ncbi:hypothetical protein ACOMHN_009020 [Nucella lapillus]
MKGRGKGNMTERHGVISRLVSTFPSKARSLISRLVSTFPSKARSLISRLVSTFPSKARSDQQTSVHISIQGTESDQQTSVHISIQGTESDQQTSVHISTDSCKAEEVLSLWSALTNFRQQQKPDNPHKDRRELKLVQTAHSPISQSRQSAVNDGEQAVIQETNRMPTPLTRPLIEIRPGHRWMHSETGGRGLCGVFLPIAACLASQRKDAT